MGARRCEGTGRGESPDAKEETAGTPAEEKLSSQGWRRRSSAGAGARRHFRFGASRSRARDEATRDGRTGGLLPDVRRPGLIPRGYRAHSGRKSQCSKLPKSHVGLHVEGFRVGCRPREMTGIPAGKWTSKLGLKETAAAGNSDSRTLAFSQASLEIFSLVCLISILSSVVMPVQRSSRNIR